MIRLFLPMLLVLAACGGSVDSQTEAQRTDPSRIEFSVFINGDNDLINVGVDGKVFNQGEASFKQWMEIAQNAPEGTSFNLYFDSNTNVPGDFNGTFLKRYRNGHLTEEQSLRETNSADPKWIDVLLSHDPSETPFKAFVFFGHGAGWRSVDNFDFSHGNESFDYLSMAPKLAEYGIDLVIFDACAMAYVETLAAYHTSVPFLIASQYELPIEGINFSELPELLAQTPTLRGTAPLKTAQMLFENIKTATELSQAQGPLRAPLGFFDLNHFLQFQGNFSNLLDALVTFKNPVVSGTEWRALLRTLKPRIRGGVLSDAFAVDLRKTVHLLSSETSFDAFAMDDTLQQLMPHQTSSVQFYLPQPDILENEAKDKLDKPWNKDLENWNWVRQWPANGRNH